jgi:hypothetical protein
MECEEFEDLGLDRPRHPSASRQVVSAAGADSDQRIACLEHAATCSRCAALQESWQEARVYIRAVSAATEDASTPSRVEMRLLQEFRSKNRKRRANVAAAILAWTFATAGLLVGAVSWWNWHETGKPSPTLSADAASGSSGVSRSLPSSQSNGVGVANAADIDSAGVDTLVAANDADQFVLLPGSLRQETGDDSVVRVRLQRGALGALGLPVNEERATEWIQVDLFVGQDGQPQAVRVPQ